MARLGLRDKGGQNLNDGSTINMLRLWLVVGNVVRSLGSGGGNTLTRGLNELLPAVGGKYIQNEQKARQPLNELSENKL